MGKIIDIESAIQHCEEVAEAEERIAKLHQRPDRGIKGSGKRYLSCLECASEHRQLAEWLRELKKLREIPDKLVPKYRDGIQDEYNRGANEMLEEVIDDIRKYMEEVNADE